MQREACSQPAPSTVHQRPNENTGIAFAGAEQEQHRWLGASIDMMPSIRIPLPDKSVITHSVAHAPITN